MRLFILFVFFINLSCIGDLFDGSNDAKILSCGDFEDDIRLEHKEGRDVDFIIDCLVDVDNIDIVFEENVVVEFTKGSGLIVREDA